MINKTLYIGDEVTRIRLQFGMAGYRSTLELIVASSKIVHGIDFSLVK